MRYVCRAEAGQGWRIWNRKTGKPWGNYFQAFPEELLAELNGAKRPDVLVELCRESYARKA